MPISRVSIAAILTALTCLPLLRDTAIADTVYRMPPKAIADVLNAPPLPVFIVNPAGDGFAMVTPLRYPPVADLARPMLRIAGLRIDPQTNGIHHAYAYTSLDIQRLHSGSNNVAMAGKPIHVVLPPGARVTSFDF